MIPIYKDFSAILAVATIVTGFIWAIDAKFFKSKRMAALALSGMPAGESTEPKLVEYARSFFPILLIVLILRSFIAEPFRIPSGSMKPTLLEGDFILVNKFTYGLHLPIFGTEILTLNKPKRGDVLVFRFPNDTSVDFIKRVIGVPGDKISYKNKVVYLNGTPLSQEYVAQNIDKESGRGSVQVKQFNEKVGEKNHAIFLQAGSGMDMEERTIPEGQYFVMGDNRDASDDSRYWGFVPEELILGKAFFIWFSIDWTTKDVRWKRIGHAIQ